MGNEGVERRQHDQYRVKVVFKKVVARPLENDYRRLEGSLIANCLLEYPEVPTRRVESEVAPDCECRIHGRQCDDKREGHPLPVKPGTKPRPNPAKDREASIPKRPPPGRFPVSGPLSQTVLIIGSSLMAIDLSPSDA